jgi:hypothetical protein
MREESAPAIRDTVNHVDVVGVVSIVTTHVFDEASNESHPSRAPVVTHHCHDTAALAVRVVDAPRVLAVRAFENTAIPSAITLLLRQRRSTFVAL